MLQSVTSKPEVWIVLAEAGTAPGAIQHHAQVIIMPATAENGHSVAECRGSVLPLLFQAFGPAS